LHHPVLSSRPRNLRKPKDSTSSQGSPFDLILTHFNLVHILVTYFPKLSFNSLFPATGWSSSNTLDLYSGGTRFESGPNYRLF